MRNAVEKQRHQSGSRALIPLTAVVGALVALALAIPGLANASTWPTGIGANLVGNTYYLHAQITTNNWWSEYYHATVTISYRDYHRDVVTYDEQANARAGVNQTYSWSINCGAVSTDDADNASATIRVEDSHGTVNTLTWWPRHDDDPNFK
ncbi:MAG TPA: hypothetical protein VMH22_09125 [bacterium]|nr:hypothetical protein [bacterium]